jgi:hypothetical protein
MVTCSSRLADLDTSLKGPAQSVNLRIAKQNDVDKRRLLTNDTLTNATNNKSSTTASEQLEYGDPALPVLLLHYNGGSTASAIPRVGLAQLGG